MATDRPPEAEALLWTLGAGPESPPAGVDWDRVTDLALDHGIAPQVSRGLRRDPEAVPEAVLDRAEMLDSECAAENLRVLRQFYRTLDLLADAGITAVPVKGPVVAELVYGDVSARQFTDVDLFVHPDDAAAAMETLRSAGYRRKWDLSPVAERGVLRYRNKAEVLPPESDSGSDVVIDLHWGYSESFNPLGVDYDAVWERTEPAEVAGRELRVLSPEDRFVYLCIHGSWEGWPKLKWILDLERLVAADALDWVEVVDRARSVHVERVVRLGTYLATDLLDASVPGWVRRWATTDPVRRLADTACETLWDPERGGREKYGHWFGYRVDVRERRIDRLGYYWRSMTLPMRRELQGPDPPGGIVGLYPAVRVASVLRNDTANLVRWLLSPGDG